MPNFENEPQVALDDEFLLLSWEHFGLKSEFPHVNPASRIGRLMIQLYSDAEIVSEELEEMPHTDISGFEEALSEQELTSRKINSVRQIVHYFGRLNGMANIRTYDGLQFLDEFRALSNSERLKVEVAKGISQGDKVDLLSTVNYAQIYLFADDWDLRKGYFPKL